MVRPERRSRADVVARGPSVTERHRAAEKLTAEIELLSRKQDSLMSNIDNLMKTVDEKLAKRAKSVSDLSLYGRSWQDHRSAQAVLLRRPVEMVSVRGIQVPANIKSLKQRIKEELQIVTATRRLKLDEDEELRRMESELAEREKDRRIRAKEEVKEEARRKDIQKRHAELQAQLALEQEAKLLSKSTGKVNKEKGKSVYLMSKDSISPRGSLRRMTYKRQNSDPMLAASCLSPTEDDVDTLRRIKCKQSAEAINELDYYSPPPHHISRQTIGRNTVASVGGSRSTMFDAKLDSYFPVVDGYGSLSRSSDLLARRLSQLERDVRLSCSQSMTSLPHATSTSRRRYRTILDEDENKEDKKQQLLMEIRMRRKHLEETRRLSNEIRKLAEMQDISPVEMENARYQYQHHVRQRDQDPPPGLSASLIQPLDYQIHQKRPLSSSYSSVPLRVGQVDSVARLSPSSMQQLYRNLSYDPADYLGGRVKNGPRRTMETDRQLQPLRSMGTYISLSTKFRQRNLIKII